MKMRYFLNVIFFRVRLRAGGRMESSFIHILRSYLFIALVVSAAACSKNSRDIVAPALVCAEDTFPAALKTQITTALSSNFPLVPGAVIAIHHPSHGYVVMSYGLSNTSTNTAMTSERIFDIGSVHKLFKWVLLERLVDQGLLSFNDLISTYVASPAISGATILNLANHSTGMVDIDSSVYDDIWTRTASGTTSFEYTYAEMMTFLAAENSSTVTNGFFNTFTLGTGYNYSSYGPVIAGAIAESITGVSYSSQIKEQIINTLELTRTSFHGIDARPETVTLGYGNDYASPVDVAGEHPQPNQNLMIATSSAVKGAIFSSGCDMVYLARAISDSSLNFMSASVIASRTATYNDFASYLKAGRGVMNYYSQNTGDFWVHAGDGAHGHSTVVGYNPTNGVSVSVLTNFNPYFMNLNYGDFAAHFKVLELLNAYY